MNKKAFHKSKQPVDLDLRLNNKRRFIILSDKFKHSDDGFRYFIGYKKSEIVKPLSIILPQMSGYIKYFENGGKSMSFVIKDDDVLDKHSEIWYSIKDELNTRFHNMPVYGEKYIKAKVREFNGVIKTNFLDDEVPKKKRTLHFHSLYNYWFCYENGKKYYPQVNLEENKKTKMPKFIYIELESESDLDLALN